MRYPLSFFIGLRYIASKRSSGFMSFVSIFATVGMGLGVFALIVVLSVMNGFDAELKQRLLRALPHGFIESRQGLSDWKSLHDEVVGQHALVAASPYIGEKVLISGRRGVKGAELQGIAPSYEKAVSPIADYLVSGDFDLLEEGEFGIVLGSLLSYSLGVRVGDTVVVTLPKVSVSLAGVFPRRRQFTVVGIFEVGAQVDQGLALTHLGDAQRLFRMADKVDGLRLSFSDLYLAPAGVKALQADVDQHYFVQDWSETQGTLFQAVKLEKTVTGILLGIIVAVAAFNIITSLIMMVTEKRSDIAVLRTMGMRRYQVMTIFVCQGCATGFLGIIAGIIFGIPVAIYLPEIMHFFEQSLGLQVFDPTVYFVTQIPSVWQPFDTLIICSVATASCVLATLYPAYRATLIEPAEAIRYND